MKKRTVEIMDTTLRDGEQTSGVSFSPSEKLTLTKLLLNELKVDRIEVASARVSKGEFDAVKQINDFFSICLTILFRDLFLELCVITIIDENFLNLLGFCINLLMETLFFEKIFVIFERTPGLSNTSNLK